jgi:protoporphyrinogen oxidase
MFFKTYTEKVWGIPCSEIQAEWASQRIKGLSLMTAVTNALFKQGKSDIKTLIDEFDYPVYGPGMMYDELKNKIVNMGGMVHMNSRVIKVNHEDFDVKSIEYADASGDVHVQEGTDFISSILKTELVGIMNIPADKEVIEAANRLSYRSLITVDIIIKKKDVFPDNWIYIHSPEVKLGRIQNFKNWSRDMISDPDKTTLGLEYFCNENDQMWNMPDNELFNLAASEVEKIKICKASDIEDYIIIRVPKAYPVYNMGYKQHLDVIGNYLKKFSNLQLVGRYGLFKYNNMDHSILTALYAAKNIENGERLFDTWTVNTDDEYHEEKK